MDSKKLNEEIQSAVGSIDAKELYNEDMAELTAIASKMPPKEFFMVSAESAIDQATALTMSRQMLAVPPDGGFQMVPGERSGIELLVQIKDVPKRLNTAGERLMEESEMLWLDILQGFLVSDERIFITSAINKSKKVRVDGLSDPEFIRYIEEREEASPGQYTLLLSDDGVNETLASAGTYDKLEKENIAHYFNPAVKQQLMAFGIFGKFGNIDLLTDIFRYDVLRVVWPEGLLAIGIGPRSEVGVVEHKPVEIKWAGDTAVLVQPVDYYDFLQQGECISFWKKGRTVG